MILLTGDPQTCQRILGIWDHRIIPFKPTYEPSPDAFTKRLLDPQVRMAILALPLQGKDPLPLLREALTRRPDLPFLLIAPPKDEALAIEALNTGAEAYLIWRRGQDLRRLFPLLQTILYRAGYRSLIHCIPMGIYRTTPDGRVLFANLGLVKLLRFPDLATLMGTPAREIFVDPEDRTRWQKEIEKFGVVQGFETRMRCYDGTVIWVRDDARAVTDADGRVLYYEGALQDITAQKKLEERYRYFVEQTAEGFYRIESRKPIPVDLPEDEQIRQMYAHMYVAECNDTFARMYGYERAEDLVGKPFIELHGSPDVPENIEVLRAFIRNGYRVVDVETKEVDREGNPRYFLNNALGIIEGGQLVAVWGTQRDITDRKRAEEAVLRHAERLRTVMEAVSEGLVLLDADRRVVLANPAGNRIIEELSGKKEGEVLETLGGVPLEYFFSPPPEGRECHTLELSKPIPRFFEVAAHAVQDGWVLVLRDITARKESETRLQAQERLAAIGRLAAGIAHDFNNLLTVIQGYAEHLQLESREGRLDPEEVQRTLEKIRDQSQRAARLIRQILDFARQSPSAKQPLDLRPYLKETVKMIRRTFPETIDIHLDFEGEAFPVEADPVELQQILMNLALNARDAMPQGGTLQIRLREQTLSESNRPFRAMKPGAWVVIEVSDTGVGIPQEILPHIFEPFFSTKPRGVGTGLGLAQVYGLVKKHNGFVDVESTPGKGTTFRIYLPRILLRKEEKPPAPLIGSHRPGEQGKTILVVEDNADVRETLKAQLQVLGYQVVLAEDGKKALALFRQQIDRIAAAIVDLVMPGMGGADLIPRLRALRKDLPVILLTGYPTEVPPRMEGVILAFKPLDLRSLKETLEKALN